jgi:hypothetical protein
MAAPNKRDRMMDRATVGYTHLKRTQNNLLGKNDVRKMTQISLQFNEQLILLKMVLGCRTTLKICLKCPCLTDIKNSL